MYLIYLSSINLIQNLQYLILLNTANFIFYDIHEESTVQYQTGQLHNLVLFTVQTVQCTVLYSKIWYYAHCTVQYHTIRRLWNGKLMKHIKQEYWIFNILYIHPIWQQVCVFHSSKIQYAYSTIFGVWYRGNFLSKRGWKWQSMQLWYCIVLI